MGLSKSQSSFPTGRPAVRGSGPLGSLFTRPRRCAALAATLLVALLTSPAWHSTAAEEQAPWNVLVITVDCLRPDHMSLYGYERDTTPYLTQFAKESVVFENAFATSTIRPSAKISPRRPKTSACGVSAPLSWT